MRVSGLKDPSFLALAAQTKTFSIYEPQISISQMNYLGPLAPGSTAKYLFLLEDTLYKGNDTVFVISYKPRSRTKFDGLKGLLYINTDGYAVQNVTAEAAERDESFSIRFQQLHEKIGGTVHAAVGAGYPESGSNNESGLHWDMVCEMRQRGTCPGGTIEGDGEVFHRNGRFVKPGWPGND